MIYIFEGSYWRTLCLSQHTSVLRLLWYIVIEKPVYLYKYILVRTCDQVGTRPNQRSKQPRRHWAAAALQLGIGERISGVSGCASPPPLSVYSPSSSPMLSPTLQVQTGHNSLIAIKEAVWGVSRLFQGTNFGTIFRPERVVKSYQTKGAWSHTYVDVDRAFERWNWQSPSWDMTPRK